MKLLLENWRKHLKEESTLPTEGSDQKKWFTVKGLRPGDKSGRDWIEIATIELPASFTIPHDSSGLYAKLTEEGHAYVTEKVPSYNPSPGMNQINPSVEPNVIPWEGTAPAAAAGTKTPDGSAIPDQWAQETKRPWEP
jgi:hypothetical protein